ncbi:MAG: alpha/beta hydrolase [Deltaproteobacteria bacterium]|nr:alpha/beta hydrolase [Deltaproteobacteria bacterium]
MNYRVLATALALTTPLAGCPDPEPVVQDAGTSDDAASASETDAPTFDAPTPPRPDAGRDTGGDAYLGDAPVRPFMDGGAFPDDPPELTFSDPPITMLPAGTRYAEEIHYGPSDEQVFDIYLPEASEPTALVIFIHGGGFTGGSRSSPSASAVRTVIGAGAAYASIDYRLLVRAGTETDGVIKCLRDSMRALQFMRHHADVLNIDPMRVGTYGGSAGAGTSLWLGFHPDMAIADSPDLVARESTRPQVVAALSTQSTYDVMRWAPEVFQEEYSFLTNEFLLTSADLRRTLVQFYGLDGALIDDINGLEDHLVTPEMIAYRAEVDMFLLMTSDDPPTYVRNDGDAAGPTDPGFDLLHHPLHARSLVRLAETRGASLEADVPAYEIESDEEAIGFMLSRLEP